MRLEDDGPASATAIGPLNPPTRASTQPLSIQFPGSMYRVASILDNTLLRLYRHQPDGRRPHLASSSRVTGSLLAINPWNACPKLPEWPALRHGSEPAHCTNRRRRPPDASPQRCSWATPAARVDIAPSPRNMISSRHASPPPSRQLGQRGRSREQHFRHHQVRPQC